METITFSQKKTLKNFFPTFWVVCIYLRVPSEFLEKALVSADKNRHIKTVVVFAKYYVLFLN